jgi:hypothetical protein
MKSIKSWVGVKDIIPKLKQFYRELFDKPFPENLKV